MNTDTSSESRIQGSIVPHILFFVACLIWSFSGILLFLGDLHVQKQRDVTIEIDGSLPIQGRYFRGTVEGGIVLLLDPAIDITGAIPILSEFQLAGLAILAVTPNALNEETVLATAMGALHRLSRLTALQEEKIFVMGLGRASEILPAAVFGKDVTIAGLVLVPDPGKTIMPPEGSGYGPGYIPTLEIVTVSNEQVPSGWERVKFTNPPVLLEYIGYQAIRYIKLWESLILGIELVNYQASLTYFREIITLFMLGSIILAALVGPYMIPLQNVQLTPVKVQVIRASLGICTAFISVFLFQNLAMASRIALPEFSTNICLLFVVFGVVLVQFTPHTIREIITSPPTVYHSFGPRNIIAATGIGVFWFSILAITTLSGWYVPSIFLKKTGLLPLYAFFSGLGYLLVSRSTNPDPENAVTRLQPGSFSILMTGMAAIALYSGLSFRLTVIALVTVFSSIRAAQTTERITQNPYLGAAVFGLVSQILLIPL